MAAVFAPIVVGSLAFLNGCGGGEEVSTATVSPEAKKADSAAQEGMMKFMESKGKSKGKASAKPAEAPKEETPKETP